jgi:glutamine amidotransferase
MITIVDYGMGNVGSIRNMLKRVGAASIVTSDPDVLARATKVILPGVGAFDNAMARINGTGVRDLLDRKALVERVPVLGICLGMQLLTRGSEEGTLAGLGWIPSETRRFPAQDGLKVPHMGWNVARAATRSCLTRGLEDDARFYFVHSYYVAVDEPGHSILTTTYGIEFHSAIQRDNVFGAQFHPEKSHRYGMHLLRNFAAI